MSPFASYDYFYSPDNCVKVSAEGFDEPRCLNYSTHTSCRTLNYPLNLGFTSVCMYGRFYNMSEQIEVVHSKGINIFCNECLLKLGEIVVTCKRGKNCAVFLQNFSITGVTIKLRNISLILSSIILHESLIVGISFLNESVYNEIRIEYSNLACYESNNCGLHLFNMNAEKVVFVASYLDNFVLDIGVGQLMLIFYDTVVIMPSINVKVNSPAYLKVPAIIRFEKVMAVNNRTILNKKDIPFKVNRNSQSELCDNCIIFYLKNPSVIVKDSYFSGIHFVIRSKGQKFESVYFEFLVEKTSLSNSFNVGNGGVLTIVSEDPDSEVMVIDSTFSNNSAVKGTGDLLGQGGAIYVAGNSIRLSLIECKFQGNKAHSAGLAIYTTEGVDASFQNCTFQYIIDPDAPIQQSLVFANGKIGEFHGLFLVFNPKPDSYVGPIDVLYIRQGSNLNIETHCPKWYNHIIDYSSVLSDNQFISDVRYKCIPCIANYYNTFIGNNTLYYSGKENNTHAERLSSGTEKRGCVQCPYGALCTGNNVIPRPNYWGYWYQSKLEFNQCPASYCCSSDVNSSCDVYDYCSGNRTGHLCGACKDEFSLSILTVACMQNSLCGGKQWFWLVVILASVGYAWWYTLKDDIFGLFFRFVRFLKNIHFARNLNANDSQTKPTLLKWKRISIFSANAVEQKVNNDVISEMDNRHDNISQRDIQWISSNRKQLLASSLPDGDNASDINF